MESFMRQTIRRRSGVAAVLMGFALLAPQAVLAASGDLDGSFGGDGIATLNATGVDFGNDVELHDGKVVVAGQTRTTDGSYDVVVARFTADGDPDSTFGPGDGFVVTDFGGAGDETVNGLAVLPNGKVLVAATSNSGPNHTRLALARYGTQGALDPAFGGGDGIVIRDYPGDGAYVYALLLLPNGKFLVAGALYPSADNSMFALWRFKPNGKIDKTFGGGDGLVTRDLSESYDEIWRLLLMPDGDILAGGWTGVGSDSDIALVRFNGNGTIDKTFGIEGVVSLNTTTEDFESVTGMARSGRKIIVVAGGRGESGLDVVILRLKANGARDASFGGGDGEVVRDLGGEDQPTDVAIQQDGKIVVAGRRNNQPVVARFMPGGDPDTGFGSGGLTDLGTPGLFAAVTLQPNGRIVAVGTDSFDDSNLLVARFEQ
jgi:uncharacterized delta-60 repeat protein